jgi:putative oxidoreductase
MRYAPLVGRILFSLLFVASSFGLFTTGGIHYAAQHGVPGASLLVPLAGVLALVGGLSVLVGFKARWGALLLVLFLVPVTLMMHNFWAVSDPQMAMIERVNFFKNVGLLGGALVIAYFGAGPVSVDEWLRTRALERAEAGRPLTPTPTPAT